MNNENTLPTGIRPSQSLYKYNHELEASLQAGFEFTKLLNVVLETKNAQDLFSATQELLKLKLGSKLVNFPHQYANNDWYLLFMTRLLELNQVTGYSLASAPDHEELGIFLAGTRTKVRYQFTQANTNEAFFTEIETNKRLFHLDFAKQTLTFSSADIIDLFIVQAETNINAEESEQVMHVLKEFAGLLAHELGFNIDYSILETNNDYRFETVTEQLPSQILDKLFIASANANVLMQPVDQGFGARLVLGDELELRFLQTEDMHVLSNLWHFEVLDAQNKASFFNVLANFPFLQRWYLENRDVLEIKPIATIVAQTSDVKVEVLMPNHEE